MATLDEIKHQINQLQLEHSNQLTELQTLISPIDQLQNQLTELQTLISPMSEKLDKIEHDIETIKKSQMALTTTQSEHKGILIGAKWMIGVGLAILTVFGGIAGAVAGAVVNGLM